MCFLLISYTIRYYPSIKSGHFKGGSPNFWTDTASHPRLASPWFNAHPPRTAPERNAACCSDANSESRALLRSSEFSFSKSYRATQKTWRKTGRNQAHEQVTCPKSGFKQRFQKIGYIPNEIAI